MRRLADELATLALLTAPEIAEYLERLPAAAPEPATAMELDRGEYLAILRELLASGSGRTTQWAAQGRDLLRAELGAERAQRFEREVAAYAFSAALRVLDEDA